MRKVTGRNVYFLETLDGINLPRPWAPHRIKSFIKDTQGWWTERADEPLPPEVTMDIEKNLDEGDDKSESSNTSDEGGDEEEELAGQDDLPERAKLELPR